MQKAVLALILFVCSGEYLISIGVLPNPVSYVLELFALATFAVVLALGVRSRFELVRPTYWLVFGGIVLVMICGIILNPFEPGPVFAGIRNYFRTLPFFFLGLVVAFSDAQIRRQLLLLTAIAIAQVPLAAYQRYTWLAQGGITGDTTTGTLQQSSYLSIYLIAAISILIAMRSRGLISLKAMGLLFVLFVFPTTINETRATFFMLPLTLLVTGLVLAKPGQRVKAFFVTVFAIVMFGAIFIPIYDQLILNRPYGATMLSFLTTEGRAEGYMDRGVGIGSTEGMEAGRLEMVTVPVQYLARDPFHLLFGFGMGSASESALGAAFSGQYYRLFKPFLAMTFARVVLELGLLGVALTLTFLWMIYRDARYVAARHEGLMGALAAGWTGVTALYVITFFYKDIIMAPALTVLFWLYSGIIAGERMRMDLRLRQHKRVSARQLVEAGRRVRTA